MATTQISGAGGTTTSFSNTPQAQGDVFNYSEDTAVVVSGSQSIILLDVLANDLGGNAKTLYSIDDGTSATTSTKQPAPLDLTTQDYQTSGISAWEDIGGGVRIRINNGKVEMDLSQYLQQHYGLSSLQALGAGDQINETFTYAIKLGNGTLSWASVNVNIQGTNDGATITAAPGADSAVVEAGGVANGTLGDPSAHGQLIISDVDAGQNHFQTPPSLQGTYGNFTFDTASGAWTYALTQALADPLTQGQHVTDTLTVTSADGTASYDIVVNITGTNDAAVITGDATGSVTEASGVANGTAGTSPATGDLDATDVDSLTDFSVVTNGVHGTLSINAAGEWSYVLNEDDAAVQALNAGDPALTDTITVQTSDGTQQNIVISINGANDAAVITGDATGSVTEASGVANGTAGTSPATGDLDATDVDSLTDFSVVTNGVHGTLSINAAGEWSYVLNEDDAAVQALNAGDPALTDTITVQTSDGTQQNIVISINGANDAAVITGDATGSVTEASGVANGTAGTSPATGDLDATDVDSLTDFSVVTNGVHGTLSINAAGEWSYALNEDDAAVQALNVGDPALTDTITVQTSDGTQQNIVISINGANDAAVITGDATGSVTEASGVANGTAGTSPATGDLDATDVDSLTDFSVVTNGVHGTLSINAAGEWSYALNEDDAAVQALNVGDPALTDTITVQTSDGTQQNIVISINGANDAAVITGDATGSVTEASGVANGTAGTSPATGDLDATDVDSLTDFSVVTNGVHGTLSINAAGEWSYALNEDDAAVQALNVGDPALTDTITVQTSDGTQQNIVISINGANDAAVITGDATGSVTEASGVANGTAGTSPATGDLDATDVDSLTDFSVVTNGVHGTLSINAAGEWSYVLNEDDAAVQALNVGDPALTDTITVQTSDGTQQNIVISINGANDAAVITGDATGSVTEASGVANGTAGTSPATGDLDATDVDSATDFSVVTNGVHGTLSINAAGEWSYALNEDDAAVQALNVGDPALTDTITVQTSDGTQQNIVISINGANDAAVITVNGVQDTSVTEKGGVANGTPGDATASGDLNATDVDNAATFNTQTAASKSYGTFSIDANGTWNYTLDDNNAAVQALNSAGANTTLHELVTVTTVDGTQQVIDITIHGANDAAALSSALLNLTEGNAAADISTSGSLTISDVDSDPHFVAQAGTAGNYGTFAIDADGNWTYTASSAHDEFVAGQHYAENFDVVSADGTHTSVAIDILGTDDGPPRFAPTDIQLTPDTSPTGDVNFNQFSFSGTLSATDPDSGSFVYSITSQSDAGLFSISGNTLSSASLTTSNTATVTVQATQVGDPAGPAYQYTETFQFITGSNGNSGETFNSPSNNGDDVLYGNGGADQIFGLAGNDTLFGQSGNDTLNGGDGNDKLVGGVGADTLTGGAGADTFYYGSDVSDSPASAANDTITDFVHGVDKIDLSSIDANTASGGDQAFLFGGLNANTVANSITWSEVGGNTIVHVDVTGNTTADFQITLTGINLGLTASDFVL